MLELLQFSSIVMKPRPDKTSPAGWWQRILRGMYRAFEWLPETLSLVSSSTNLDSQIHKNKITFSNPQHLESFSGASSLLLGLKVPHKIHQSVWHQNSVPITALACLGDLSFIPQPQDKLPKFLCNTWKTMSFPQRAWVKLRDFSLGFMF